MPAASRFNALGGDTVRERVDEDVAFVARVVVVLDIDAIHTLTSRARYELSQRSRSLRQHCLRSSCDQHCCGCVPSSA